MQRRLAALGDYDARSSNSRVISIIVRRNPARANGRSATVVMRLDEEGAEPADAGQVGGDGGADSDHDRRAYGMCTCGWSGSVRTQMLRKLIGALGSPCAWSLIGSGPWAW